MATTSSNLTAGKAIAGQAGDGRGYTGRAAGLAAAAALGVALLTGMIVSQARQAAPPTAGPAASIAQADGAERQLFLEQNTQLPAAVTSAFVPDQFTYREDHRQVAPAVAADTFVPDQFTYREDHRGELAGQAGTRSGGSYADIVWELEQGR